jgi:hypothetical protein
VSHPLQALNIARLWKKHDRCPFNFINNFQIPWLPDGGLMNPILVVGLLLLAAPCAAQTLNAAAPSPQATVLPPAAAEPEALRAWLEDQKRRLDAEYRELVVLEAEIARRRQTLNPGESLKELDQKSVQLKAREALYKKNQQGYESEAARYQRMIQGDAAAAAPPARQPPEPAAGTSAVESQEQMRLQTQREALEKERQQLAAEKQALDNDADLAEKNSTRAAAYRQQVAAFNQKVKAYDDRRQAYFDAITDHNARVAGQRRAMAVEAGLAPAAGSAVPAPSAAAGADSAKDAAAAPGADAVRQRLNARRKALDVESRALMTEKSELEALRDQAKTPDEGRAANLKIVELNEKIKALEEKRSAFNIDVEAFNATQPSVDKQ